MKRIKSSNQRMTNSSRMNINHERIKLSKYQNYSSNIRMIKAFKEATKPHPGHP